MNSPSNEARALQGRIWSAIQPKRIDPKTFERTIVEPSLRPWEVA